MNKGIYQAAGGITFTFKSTEKMVRLYYDKRSQMWTNLVRGKSAGKLTSDGDGLKVELDGTSCYLDYDQAERLYLLLTEEREARKANRVSSVDIIRRYVR